MKCDSEKSTNGTKMCELLV